MGRIQSKHFQNDDRLETCAVQDSAHVMPGSIGEFVSRIQTALLAIDNATIASGEISAAHYGPSTAAAVLSYKQNHRPPIINRAYQQVADNIVGKMTIAALDQDMLEIEKRATPPVPPRPQSLGFDKAKQEIRSYLAREAKWNVGEVLLGHPASLLIFGEVHFAGDPMKGFLFSELISRMRARRPVQTHFHASERFTNDQSTRNRISEMLQAHPFNMVSLAGKLPTELRPFLPVLAAANSFPGRRYGVVPSDSSAGAGEDARHEAIFNAFNDAAVRCPDVPPRSINSTVSRGSILLGARHAARRNVGGRAADTTCARFVKAGWTVHSMRLTVPFFVGDGSPAEDLNLRLLRSSDTRVINGLDLVENVAGGRSFYADITKADSPFAMLKDDDSGSMDIPFNQLFDAIVHLGGRAVL